MISFDWTFIFMILNITLLLGIIYLVFFLIVKLPKRKSNYEKRLEKVEKLLEEINNKLQK